MKVIGSSDVKNGNNILANGKDDGCIYSEVSNEKYFNEI